MSKYQIEFDEGQKTAYLRVDSFEPKHIFECGQAFRWFVEDDGSYTTVDADSFINVKKNDDLIILKNCSQDDFYNKWENYFDLNTDYEQIKRELSFNETLRDAIDYGYGIRILNQDQFSTIISFIISANNQIPRIMKSVDLICKNYGNPIGSFKGRELYSFPTPKVLASLEADELREICRVGFRDRRIIDTSSEIAKGNFDIKKSLSLPDEELKEELMKLPGVGPKVSDCIMLYSYKRSSTFPVDVWIKRVMEFLFIKEETKKSLISSYAHDLFGDAAGYAQQYLFYYGRENSIGK
ncbi:MAG: DNA glycosylase [Finegoldia sp.]|nr:DNA glycosylase [Finegoldia sp.]